MFTPPTGDNIYDIKCNFYEELKCVFAKFPKFHILLDFNATSKNPIVKITMFPHHNIHKFTWTSPGVKRTKLIIF
jgi:hypothetical protein